MAAAPWNGHTRAGERLHRSSALPSADGPAVASRSPGVASAGRMLPALIPAGPAQGTRLCRPRGHWSCHHREDGSPNKNLPGLCEEAQPGLGCSCWGWCSRKGGGKADPAGFLHRKRDPSVSAWRWLCPGHRHKARELSRTIPELDVTVAEHSPEPGGCDGSGKGWMLCWFFRVFRCSQLHRRRQIPTLQDVGMAKQSYSLSPALLCREH